MKNLKLKELQKNFKVLRKNESKEIFGGLAYRIYFCEGGRRQLGYISDSSGEWRVHDLLGNDLGDINFGQC